MLRVPTGLLQRLAVTESKTGLMPFALEFVRLRYVKRKPRDAPVAKSKMFRVPERKRQTPEEKEELKRLHDNYKTQLRTVLRFLREENKRLVETATAANYVLTPEQEYDEFQRCVSENDNWNMEVAAIRKERLAVAKKETEEYVKNRLMLAQEKEEKELAKIEAIVKKQKELSKTFIKREDLEAAIEHALANPVDHNFAIDKHGNIYRGRNNTPVRQNLQVPADNENRIAVEN